MTVVEFPTIFLEDQMVDKQKHSGDTGRSILRQIDELQRMSMSELRKKWNALIGGDSAKQSKQYMVRRLAYRLQELSLGGFAKTTRDSLTGWAVNPKKAESKAVREKASLQLGTRLLRDWHGQRYEVIVQEDGFLFEGKRYRSLSAISRAITGRHCNGRRFFGLQSSGSRGDDK